MIARSRVDAVGDMTSALTLPRALKLLLDPKTPLSPDAPGLSSSLFFFRFFGVSDCVLFAL